MNDLISALRHTLYKTHDKSDACMGCVHAEAVLVEADREPKALLPAELMAVVETLRQVRRYFDAKFDTRELSHLPACYERADEALSAWDAVLDGSSGAPGNPASVSTLSSFSTTGAEEPSGTTEGGTDECGVEGHAAQDRMRCLEGSAGQPRLVAGLSGTAPTEDQRGNSGAGIRPGHSSVAPPANTVPPVADLGPAESQPARDPASDVHAGGGEPALGMCTNAGEGYGPHVRSSVCVGWQPLLPDYLSTLRDLYEEVLGRGKP